MIEAHAVEQSLRRSHCQRTGHEHRCSGVMTVTPAGIELSCAVCGSTSEPYYPNAVRSATARLSRLLGGDWDALAPETQDRALQFVNAMTGGLDHQRGEWVKQ